MTSILEVKQNAITDGFVNRVNEYHQQFQSSELLDISGLVLDHTQPKGFINELLDQPWREVGILAKQVDQKIVGDEEIIMSLFTDGFANRVVMVIIKDNSAGAIKNKVYVGYIKNNLLLTDMFSKLKLYVEHFMYI